MAKHMLKEGIIERALIAIFTAIAKNKKDFLMKQLENDSEFQKLIADLDEKKKQLRARLEKKRETDPRFAEWEKSHSNIFDIK